MKMYLELLFVICLSFALVACANKVATEDIDEHNYAENPIVEQSNEETEEELEPIVELEEYEDEDEEIEREPIKIEPKEMKYNTSEDKYVHDVTDMSTISIDGQLLVFPCDYNYISEKFNDLYIEETNKYIIKKSIDTTAVSNEFIINATPQTGNGIIKFIFRSEEPSTILDMKCVGFNIYGGNNEGSEVMTCALPNYISFGSSLDDLYDYFGTNTGNKSYVRDRKNNFMLFYSLENVDLQLTGYDDGLYAVNAIYK